jgi:hypothetical protein
MRATVFEPTDPRLNWNRKRCEARRARWLQDATRPPRPTTPAATQKGPQASIGFLAGRAFGSAGDTKTREHIAARFE